jgi:hypothetical protein
MVWYDIIEAGLYSSHSDNYGIPATYRDILFGYFGKSHDYYDLDLRRTVGPVNDLETIMTLRSLDRNDPDYNEKKKALKKTLQCFTPAALLKCKKRGQVEVISRTGIIQLDFDYAEVCDYDLEELKQALFYGLPWIAFCSLSCSGDGIFALGMIAEPDRLSEYAETIFHVLEHEYGLKVDTSKGKKPENLRYLSWDERFLLRDYPETLKIPPLPPKPKPKKVEYVNNTGASSPLVLKGLKEIYNALPGYRCPTIQKWAYTLGGMQDRSVLSLIKQTIKEAPSYNGEEDEFLSIAEAQFTAGLNNPLKSKE